MPNGKENSMADVKVVLERSKYKQLAYIEGTGTQYIKTGPISRSNKTRIYIDYQFTNENYNDFVFYMDSFEANIDRFGIYMGYYDYYTYRLNINSQPIPFDLNRHTFEINNDNFKFDGETATIQRTLSARGDSTGLVLFRDISTRAIAYYKFYECKVGNNYGDYMHLVPALRVADNTVGVYDKINDEFYINSGTGEFVAGPEVGNIGEYVIGRFNGLKSVESTSQSTPDGKSINYGVIPNTGSVEIVDSYGKIADMITSGEISNSNLKTIIKANGREVQHHISNDSDYDTNDKIFTSQFTNTLEKWETLQYGGYIYPLQSKTAYNLLLDVLSSIGYTTQQIDGMLDGYVISGTSSEVTVKTYLQSISLEYPYLKADTIRNTVDKICVVAQLQVFEGDNGEIKFIGARPRKLQNLPILVVPQKSQFSEFRKDFILKNKYDGIEMNQTVVEKNNIGDRACGVASVTTSGYDEQTTQVELDSIESGYHVARFYAYYYKNISVTIPAKSADNLSSTIALNGFSANSSGGTTNYGDMLVFSAYSTLMQQNLTLNPRTDNFAYESARAQVMKEKILSYTYNATNDTFTVNMYVCVGRNVSIKIWLNSMSNAETLSSNVMADRITFNFNGSQEVIEFKEESASTTGVGGAKTVAGIRNSEILQSTSTISGTGNNIPTQIKANILGDYANGIATADITIMCGDYYDLEGNKVIDWDAGELIQVGDIVRIDKNNAGTSASIDSEGNDIYYRVVSRKFRYAGCPYIDLGLQQLV